MKQAMILLPLIAGCVTTWQKPGATDSDVYSDRVSCIALANSLWPVEQTRIGSGTTSPTSTQCRRIGNNVYCEQTGGQYTPPPVVDTNGFARTAEVRKCMRARGYEQK